MFRIAGFCLIFCGMLSLPLRAQTPILSSGHGYLMPGDSIWHELALQAGDQITWNLWLPAAGRDAGTSVLSFTSSAEGELWQRSFGSEPVNLREDIKITKPAHYRLMLTSHGQRGRAADLNAWTKYGPGNRTPFPPPSMQRIAETFSPGDKFIVEYEFLFSDTIRLQTLRELELPKNLAYAWAVTPIGDSIAADASVSRWVGDAGIIRLRERAPQGGTITLHLEIEISEGGESTVFITPGPRPPAWLPREARLTTMHVHAPWKSVLVPPIHLARDARQPDIARAKYAAISFRAHGLDPETVKQLTRVYEERDSLTAERFARSRSITTYDTSFLFAAHAFLPPEMHVAHTTPLERKPMDKKKALVRKRSITWFVDGPPAVIPETKLYEWHYDESRVALPTAKDEIFWDSTLVPMRPELHRHDPVGAEHPVVLVPPPAGYLEEKEGQRNYILHHQNVWGLYLWNPTADTLVLAWRPQVEVERPLLSGFKRWPKLARYAVIIFGILALLGIYPLYELRRREQRRMKVAKELDAELEKARQVQLKLLPSAPLNVTGIEIYGLHQSMQSVGGDYYDFFPLEDGSVILCVADVAGHGLAAAMLMSNLQATLRAVSQSGKSVSEMVSLLNREMFNRTSPERFVTLILARISADRSLITICNAGHNPGYLVRTNGNIVELDAGGLMLGVMDIFPFIEIDEGLDPGDMIVFYTDGIPEATIAEKDMFGYDRLKYYLNNNRGERLSDIAQGLFRKVTPPGHGMIEDDMAIVLVRVKPERKTTSTPRATAEKETRS